MKFVSLATIALIGTTQAAPAEPVDAKEKMMWHAEGLKGLHDGFNKAFYKTGGQQLDEKCLDDPTLQSASDLYNFMHHPTMANITEDLSLFAKTASIMENMAACKFEGPLIDISLFCTKNAENCLMNKMVENLTKNMFVLVGKLTSMGETFTGFPSKEKDTYKHQMEELGDDVGTLARVLLNYHKD